MSESVKVEVNLKIVVDTPDGLDMVMKALKQLMPSSTPPPAYSPEHGQVKVIGNPYYIDGNLKLPKMVEDEYNEARKENHARMSSEKTEDPATMMSDRSRLPPMDKQVLTDLSAQGKTVSEIAMHLNRSFGTVYGALHRFGIPINKARKGKND